MPRPTDRIGSLPLSPATFAERDDTLRDLARRMAVAHARCLLLHRRDGSLAFVSEHDVVHALASAANPDDVWAVDVMSSGVVAEQATRPITEVAELMRSVPVRHVIVMDGDTVLGVASVHDVLGVLVDALDPAEASSS
jgi:CBS domain-containing protein